MESAGHAGHALGNDFSVRVDENAHFNSLVLRRAMCLLMSNTAKETTNTAPHNSSPSGTIKGLIKTCPPLSGSARVMEMSMKRASGANTTGLKTHRQVRLNAANLKDRKATRLNSS